MRGLRYLLHRRHLCHRDIAQWVKELDRQLEFLVEELAHVRRARAPPAKEDALGRVALLLAPVMADRAHQLGVQSRHRAANDLRHARKIDIGRLGVRAAETNESIALLPKFG